MLLANATNGDVTPSSRTIAFRTVITVRDRTRKQKTKKEEESITCMYVSGGPRFIRPLHCEIQDLLWFETVSW
jgi:hypothetical protein